MPGAFRKIADLPPVLPVFPLDGALLLPHGNLPLNIFEPRYLNMIDDALAGQRLIGMVQTRAGGTPARPELCDVGCVGKITSFSETGDGRYMITLTGIARFRLGRELSVVSPYRQVAVDYDGFEADMAPPTEDDGFDRMVFLSALKAYLDHRGLDIEWEGAREAPIASLVNSLAMALPFEPAEKQALLEAPSLGDRRDALIALLEIDAADEGDDEPRSMQ
jgi:Lon protease-like protein